MATKAHDRPENSRKRPFLDGKLAIEWARRLKTARNLLVVIRLGSAVVLSYLDVRFEPQCGRKDFLTACLLLLLLAACCFHIQYDRPQTWLKNGLFSPRNCPPRGTRLNPHPFAIL